VKKSNLDPDLLLDCFITARVLGTITCDKPMKARVLVEMLFKSRKVETTDREVRLAINELVAQGLPICSTNGGYYLALKSEEVAPATRYIDSYAKELLQRRSRLNRIEKVLSKHHPDLFTHPTVETLRKWFKELRDEAVRDGS